MLTFVTFLATAAFFWALDAIDRRRRFNARINRRVSDIAREG
jgi:hypothetical protein